MSVGPARARRFLSSRARLPRRAATALLAAAGAQARRLVVPQWSRRRSMSALRARCHRTRAVFGVMPSSAARSVTGVSSMTTRCRTVRSGEAVRQLVGASTHRGSAGAFAMHHALTLTPPTCGASSSDCCDQHTTADPVAPWIAAGLIPREARCLARQGVLLNVRLGASVVCPRASGWRRGAGPPRGPGCLTGPVTQM
jgi:hypothetical protein